MRVSFASAVLLAGAVLVSGTVDARRPRDAATIAAGRGPANGTVLLIRHAEKPAAGRGLAEAGVNCAEDYVSYFRALRLGNSPTQIHSLVAAADSADSSRSRLTLMPLSHALGLPVQQPFANRDVEKVASWLASPPRNQTFLVAWHRGQMPNLLACLGADPASLLPDGDWPDDVYDWVIALRFDTRGRLVAAQRIIQPDPLSAG